MPLQNLFQHTRPIIKEAFNGTLQLAKFFCGLHVTNSYICTVILGAGPSMMPTINLTGTFMLVDRLSTRFGKMGTGDVVLVRSVIEPRIVTCKRIIGVEGDVVSYVDLSSGKSNKKEATIVVPKGHVWIEGDNPENSRDSRMFGPVPFGLIEGRMVWMLWPPENFGPLPRRVCQHDLQKVQFSDQVPSDN